MLSSAERARAEAFLAPIQRPVGPSGQLRTSVWTGLFDDVDGDDRADCWVFYTNDEGVLVLLVWPSCEGDRETPVGKFHNPRIGMAVSPIPMRLATSPWLLWLARRLSGDSPIDCVGDTIPDCSPPGPAWRWVLAAGNRERAEPGMHGLVANDWQPEGRRVVAKTLIVPATNADSWLRANTGLISGTPGAWLLLDEGFDRGADPVQCGGFEITVDKGGILANDLRARRWRWLFRGLPDYRGFMPRSIMCVNDMVVAETRWPVDFVVIDVITGGWLFVSSLEYEGVNHLYQAATKRRLWRRRASIEPLAAMRALVHARASR